MFRALGKGLAIAFLLAQTAAAQTTLESSQFQITVVSDPAWFVAMSDKVWTSISSNTLEDVAPSPTPAGTTGTRSVMQSWGGAAVSEPHYSLVIAGAGGHANYAGNEVYEFRLNQASPTWYRLTDPSTASNAEEYADGTPSSSHTYGLPVSDGTGKIWLHTLAFYWQAGNTSRQVWSFDIDSTTWTKYGTLDLNGNPNGSAAFHSGNGHIYALNRNGGTVQMGKVNTANGDRTEFSISNPIAGQGGAVIDADADAMIHVGQNGVMVFDVSDDTPTKTTISSLGTDVNDSQGLIYDAAANSGVGALYVYDGGQDIQKVTMPADRFSTSGWSVANVSGISGATPGSSQGNGTFGRFNMVVMPSGDRCIIVVHAWDTAVFALRVPAGGL